VAAKAYGIDLGTRTIKIYKEREGIVVDEKNVMAVNEKGEILAIGDEAFEMYEKTPESIQVTFPMQQGVIADFSNMSELLRAFITTRIKSNAGNKSFYIAVPTDITEVEKRAFLDLVENAHLRAKKVYVVEKPIADAVGAGLDVKNPNGIMMVDIGADTSEITIMSLGGIVISKLLNIGGNKLDEDIIMYVKKVKNVMIGMKSAEDCKIQLACATHGLKDAVKVQGRNMVTGLPVSVEVTGDMVFEAISEDLHTLMDSVKVILERTPPEISSDIIDNGVFVTGGCSNIRNMAELITNETELHANFFDVPQETVIKGLGRIIEEDDLRELASSLNDSKYE
jgi:rod shape-determining protein MreB